MIDATAWDRLPAVVVHTGIRRRTFETGHVTLVRYVFPPRAVLPSHTHPKAQVTLVLDGRFEPGPIAGGAEARRRPGKPGSRQHTA